MTTNIAPQGLFGPGIAVVTRTDVTPSTPVNVGLVNEVSYDLKGTTKQLFGQNQYPVLVARGTIKASGKIKAAVASGRALNDAFIGGTWTAGTQYAMQTTAATPIPTTPFQITPTVPSSGTWDVDLGVLNSATGVPMTKVTSAPAAGQYSVAAGVYTFSSADQVSGVSVIISFAYHYATGAAGQFQIVTNQPIGTTPTFQLDFQTILYGVTWYVRFYNCIMSSYALNHKLEDFAMPEFDFEFFSNAANQILLISPGTLA